MNAMAPQPMTPAFDADQAALDLAGDIIAAGQPFLATADCVRRAAEIRTASRTAFDMLLGTVVRRVATRDFKAAVTARCKATATPVAAAPVFESGDWRANLKRTVTGEARAVQLNAELALKFDEAMAGVIGFDEFKDTIMMMRAAPWVAAEGFKPRRWTDGDDLKATSWVQSMDIFANAEVVAKAVEAVAEDAKFDSLADWIRATKWDGESRIEGWLTLFCGAEDSIYTRAVARRFLIGAVGRALRPGTKFDTMLVLEGDQGLRKSTFARVLGGGGAFFNGTLADMGSKDSREGLRGSWIVEVAELDAMTRKDSSTAKAFLATETDRFRRAYGRRDTEFQRRCVFLGTFNPDGVGYIKDQTGGRRFWPVVCRAVTTDGHLDIDGFQEVLPQLLAEAVVHMEAGEQAHLTQEEEEFAREQQDERMDRDAWHEVVAKYLADLGTGEVSVHDVLSDATVKSKGDMTQVDQNRVARILKRIGMERKQRRTPKGGRTWVYAWPDGVSNVVPLNPAAIRA